MKTKKVFKISGILLFLVIFSFVFWKLETTSRADSESPNDIEFSIELNNDKSSTHTESQGYDVFIANKVIAVDVFLNTPNSNLSYFDLKVATDSPYLNEQEVGGNKVEIDSEFNKKYGKYITIDDEDRKIVFNSEDESESENKFYLNSDSKIKIATFYFNTGSSTIQTNPEYNPKNIIKFVTITPYVNLRRDGVKLESLYNSYKYRVSTQPTSITFDQEELSGLKAGDIREINPLVRADIYDEEFEEYYDWSSSACQKVVVEIDNPSILKAFYDEDNTLKIKALSEGQTDITFVSAMDNNIKSEKYNIVVRKADERSVTDFTIINPINKIDIFDCYFLDVDVTPDYAENQDVLYESSDPSVATISSNGRIDALKVGKTTITVYCGAISKTMDLEVVNKVKSLKILNPLSYGSIWGTYNVKVKVEPKEYERNVKIRISGTETYNIYSNAYSIRDIGRAKVTAYIGDVEDSYYITILPSINETEGVRINNRQENLVKNTTYKLDTTVLPIDDSSHKETYSSDIINYSSSDSSIATIDENGLITTIAPGTTTITASISTKDGVATDSFKLTVHDEPVPLTKIELQNKSVTLKTSSGQENQNKSDKIYINYDPNDTTMSKDIKCESANNDIARAVKGFDDKGNYIIVESGSKIGTTTITVSSVEDENIKDVITVKTYGAQFKESYLYLDVGKSYKPEYIIQLPDEDDEVFTEKYEITYSFPYEGYNTTGNVISVDENTGTITALDNGTANVLLTIGTKQGKFYKTECTVISKVKVDKIDIDKDMVEVPVGSNSKDWGFVINISPENAYDRYTTATSSDETIVGYDSYNNLVALKPGKVTIKVKSNSYEDVYDTVVVNVVNKMHENRRKVQAEPSTCVKQGHGEYEICNICGEIVSGSDELLPLDPNNHVHTELRNKKEVTVTEDGYTGDLYCKDCGKLLKKGQVINKPDNVVDVVKTGGQQVIHTLVKTGGNYFMDIAKVLFVILVAVAVVLIIRIKRIKNKRK